MLLQHAMHGSELKVYSNFTCEYVFVVCVCGFGWFFFDFFVCFNPFLLALHLCVCSPAHWFTCLYCFMGYVALLFSFHSISHTERASGRVCRKVNAPRQHLIKCRSISAAAFHLFIVKNRVTRAYNIIMHRGNIHTQTHAHRKKELPRVHRKKRTRCLVSCNM